jgi:hypothetical protein
MTLVQPPPVPQKQECEPAFPTFAPEYQCSPGMTLRDYFAGVALPPLLRATASRQTAAEWSYEVADAMLKAREKRLGRRAVGRRKQVATRPVSVILGCRLLVVVLERTARTADVPS